MCNCEYCIVCDCGHSADSHIAGEGNCFVCKCGQFHSLVTDAWDRLSVAEHTTMSFKEFADSFVASRES